MIRVGEEELNVLSKATGVSVLDIQKLHSMGLFKDHAILSCMVRYDDGRLKRMGKYTSSQIFFVLTNKYHITKYTPQNMVYPKHRRFFYCDQCGREIRKSVYERNDGLCDQCVALSINLNDLE